MHYIVLFILNNFVLFFLFLNRLFWWGGWARWWGLDTICCLSQWGWGVRSFRSRWRNLHSEVPFLLVGRLVGWGRWGFITSITSTHQLILPGRLVAAWGRPSNWRFKFLLSFFSCNCLFFHCNYFLKIVITGK
jgi:hypothetical protein